MSGDGVDQPCYSARLVRPFVDLVRGAPWAPPAILQWLDGLQPDDRVPAAPMHQLLEMTAALTQNEYIGVWAAREMRFGDAGVLDYAISSAETVEDVMRTACRYMRLLADPVDFNVGVEGERVHVRHESKLPPLRYVEDFQLCGFLRNHMRLWPPEVVEDIEVWFMHSEPQSREEYVRTLGTTRLHFGSDFTGFSFSAKYLNARLGAADARLHNVILAHADALVSALNAQKSVTERVREILRKQLATGDLGVEAVAKRMHMSSRTLGRRLADEETTFSNVLDDERKELGLRHVSEGSTPLTDVALLTGFADVPSFYRAFRRWTGMTPVEYRNRRR